MTVLICDICGGQLTMDSNGDFAVCESCGMKHTKERIRVKAQESNGTVIINDYNAQQEQISNWEKLANDAFTNSNYAEAYTYYCKILEKKVDYWFATYRKGMSIGWQGNLNNMHGNEVLGGVIDATKLLYTDKSQDDCLKANGSFIMATEVYNWINAINNLAVNHCNQYGNQLVSAAREFYQREQQICSLLKFNIEMITEFVYENYENKEGVEKVANAICNLGYTVAGNMNASFRVKTGVKWNSFWCTYEDDYEDVYPDYITQTVRNDLTSAISTFQSNIRTWKTNYEKKIAEQERKKREEKRAKYWEEHAAEKHQYETRLFEIGSEIKKLTQQMDAYNAKISEIQKKLLQTVDGESKLEEIKQNQNNLKQQKSQLGWFVGKQKKQLQAQIDALQPQIDELEELVNCQKQAIKEDVTVRVAVVEAECKPLEDRISALEREKSAIITELKKDR